LFDFLFNVQILFPIETTPQRNPSLFSTDPAKCPRDVLSDQRLVIIQRNDKRGDIGWIPYIPERHGGVSLQAAPFGSLDRALTEPPTESFLV
tara:strand:+ start:55 stop:330 length:276 start_codon:yes stop_codon:yes gene_type:complete